MTMHRYRQSPMFWKHKHESRSSFTLLDGIEEQEMRQLELMTTSLKSLGTHTIGLVQQFEFVTFHQSFSYEDFVEGIKPVMDESDEGNLTLQIVGVFKKFCERAPSES